MKKVKITCFIPKNFGLRMEFACECGRIYRIYTPSKDPILVDSRLKVKKKGR